MFRFFKRLIAGLVPNRKMRHKIRAAEPTRSIHNLLYRKMNAWAGDHKDIPIFIISYNRLDCLRNLVTYLENSGYANIQIINNCSSYPPLMEYLMTSKHKVHHLAHNYGHFAFWQCGKFMEIARTSFYVVTDPDVIPIQDCPDSFLETFYNVLVKYPKLTKVGFSLKIDDLPDHYPLKDVVINHESRFYRNQTTNIDNLVLYDAPIDTTFALYAPSAKSILDSHFYDAIRVGYPFQARHLPWYKDFQKETEEDQFYRTTSIPGVSTWNNTKTREQIISELLDQN